MIYSVCSQGWYIGITAASQAVKAGSTPVPCSKKKNHPLGGFSFWNAAGRVELAASTCAHQRTDCCRISRRAACPQAAVPVCPERKLFRAAHAHGGVGAPRPTDGDMETLWGLRGQPFPGRRAVGAGPARPGGWRERPSMVRSVGRGLDPAAAYRRREPQKPLRPRKLGHLPAARGGFLRTAPPRRLFFPFIRCQQPSKYPRPP